MQHLVALYCLITAISVLLCLLHVKLLLAAYIAFAAIFAVAIGDELRTLLKPGSIAQKMIRALMSVFMLVVTYWLSRYFRIDLYFYALGGTIWCALGILLGFTANQGIVDRRRRPR